MPVFNILILTILQKKGAAANMQQPFKGEEGRLMNAIRVPALPNVQGR